MKPKFKALLALVLLTGILMLGFQVVQAASVLDKPLYASNAAACIANGGTYTSINVGLGAWKCIYPPGSSGHTLSGQCSNYEYFVTGAFPIVENQDLQRRVFSRTAPKPNRSSVFFSSYCITVPQSPPGYGHCGNEIANTPDPVTLISCDGTVIVAFDAGTCVGKCTITPHVIAVLEKKLAQVDGEVIGAAYVKVRNPGGGSYKICIAGEGTIYQWISGEWRALSTSTAAGQSCAFGSGDGNYILVSND